LKAPPGAASIGTMLAIGSTSALAWDPSGVP
jgi:hypothetical protein